MSATIGLDDPTVFNRTSVLNLGVAATLLGLQRVPQATAAGANAYGGGARARHRRQHPRRPGLGLFQISGAAHLVNASYNILGLGGVPALLLSEISGHPEDKWGGSVMAALQIKNIPTGPATV